MKEIIEKLSAHFEPHEIEWRVGSTTADKKKGMMLAYVTNRAIMSRLDDVVGAENWKQSFRELHQKGVICSLSIRFPETGEWVTKEDGADLTNIEPTKGGLSDAMKRAAVQFGIGRYLYDSISEWVELKDGKYPVTKPTSVKLKPKPVKAMTSDEACAKLAESTTVEQLETVYKSLPASVKTENVIAKAKEVKANILETITE